MEGILHQLEKMNGRVRETEQETAVLSSLKIGDRLGLMEHGFARVKGIGWVLSLIFGAVITILGLKK